MANKHSTRFDVVREGLTDEVGRAAKASWVALDEIELSYTAAIAQRDRYRTAHARLEEQLEAAREAVQACYDDLQRYAPPHWRNQGKGEILARNFLTSIPASAPVDPDDPDDLSGARDTGNESLTGAEFLITNDPHGIVSNPAISLDESLAQADRDLAEGKARPASEVFADLGLSDDADPASERWPGATAFYRAVQNQDTEPTDG